MPHLSRKFVVKKNPARVSFLKKLASYAKKCSPFFMYESLSSFPDKYCSFETIAALGSITEFSPKKGTGSLNDFQKYCAASGDWLFGFLSYDLKNEIEKLDSDNFEGITIPSLYFSRPEYLFITEGEKVKIGFCPGYTTRQQADDLFNRICSTDTGDEPFPGNLPIRQRVSKAHYLKTAERIKKHIQLGDIYEMNYCIEFFSEQARLDPSGIYRKFREISAAPFSAFCRFGDNYLVSSSPERFLKKTGSKLISQPIKGTAKRGASAKEDERIKRQLRGDTKEQSENVMIVDLVRNDLSRIAKPGTVKVDELFGIYTFRQVHQMISTISCKIEKGRTFTDIIRAMFPMGSMTGAPKISAMNLIEKYESTKRGLYSGAVGYITPDGNFDFSVVIRSILYNSKNRYLSFMAGSAITDKSDPEKEYEECLLKAKTMFEALK